MEIEEITEAAFLALCAEHQKYDPDDWEVRKLPPAALPPGWTALRTTVNSGPGLDYDEFVACKGPDGLAFYFKTHWKMPRTLVSALAGAERDVRALFAQGDVRAGLAAKVDSERLRQVLGVEFVRANGFAVTDAQVASWAAESRQAPQGSGPAQAGAKRTIPRRGAHWRRQRRVWLSIEQDVRNGLPPDNAAGSRSITSKLQRDPAVCDIAPKTPKTLRKIIANGLAGLYDENLP